MTRDNPSTVYTEIKVDENSISLAMLSQGHSEPVVEDTQRYTFEELQDMAGSHETLRLSEKTREQMMQPRLKVILRPVVN
jgi:hypothetical protein